MVDAGTGVDGPPDALELFPAVDDDVAHLHRNKLLPLFGWEQVWVLPGVPDVFGV
jgi:hypothetical protein